MQTSRMHLLQPHLRLLETQRQCHKKHPPLRLALLLLCNVLLTGGLLAVIKHTRQNGAYE
jgi:hypothetical protein